MKKISELIGSSGTAWIKINDDGLEKLLKELKHVFGDAIDIDVTREIIISNAE